LPVDEKGLLHQDDRDMISPLKNADLSETDLSQSNPTGEGRDFHDLFFAPLRLSGSWKIAVAWVLQNKAGFRL
jgi:hypothetical protein